MVSFAAFMEDAKPTEIRLLTDMLAEWQDWGGSLRKGNFFRGVAEAVSADDTQTRLGRWPKDGVRLAAAQAQVGRRAARSRSR